MIIINIIVDLTIATYQFDLTLNPMHFNCGMKDNCAHDAAQ